MSDIEHCLPLMLTGTTALLGAAYFVLREPRLRRRTIEEVADFLQQPDREQLLLCLDPDQDDLWRRHNNRRTQRVRVQRFHESLGVTLGCARVLHEWGDTERFDNKQLDLGYSHTLLEAIDDLISLSEQYIKMAGSVRRDLHIAALSHFDRWAFMPVPRLSKYAVVDGLNLLETYTAVGRAGLLLTEAHADVEPIAQRIRSCFWTDSAF